MGGIRDDRLLSITRPVRYIDHEINAVRKDPAGRLRFCLAFGDVYEVAMSHIGFKMLYERLNALDSVYAERFFSPWVDAVEAFGSEIFTSLETGTALKDFDVIGFSLQYELSYTNLAAALLHGGIPVRRAARSESDPIIIAGGPCAMNPAPLAGIVDCFFMGEMDEELARVMDEYAKLKAGGADRGALLAFLDSKEYTWLPGVSADKIAVRKVYTGFSGDVTVKKLLVPLMPIVQDRVAVEISRGCTRGCRFCQAGYIYRPARERGVDTVIDDAFGQLASSGYLEVSLLSLSAADYSCLEPLMVRLASLLRDSNISLSLPSLRADAIREFIFRELSRVRKSGFTIAPEAGSQRLRNVINKNLSEEDILNAVSRAKEAGWNGAKLYFMLGLPTETDEDILAIAELAGKVKRAVRSGGGFNVTVSASNFVPKAHTPFQWDGQCDAETLRNRQRMLRNELKDRKIPFKFHDVNQSVLEAVFSRGDERLSEVLIDAAENGRMFDGWSERFDMNAWRTIFDRHGISPEELAAHSYPENEPLPWHMVESGVTNGFLLDEKRRAESERVTEDCRVDNCSDCGVCDFDAVMNITAEAEEVLATFAPEGEEAAPPAVAWYEMRFAKQGAGRFLSAIETSRVLVHALTIANSGLAFSAGFNPHPKLRTVLPLSVGVSGLNEVAYFGVTKTLDKDIIQTLNGVLPEGVEALSISPSNKDDGKGTVRMVYSMSAEAYDLVKSAHESGTASYDKTTKKGKPKTVSMGDYDPQFKDDTLILSAGQSGLFNIPEFFRSRDFPAEKVGLVRRDLIES